jgi:hypothetical protein
MSTDQLVTSSDLASAYACNYLMFTVVYHVHYVFDNRERQSNTTLMIGSPSRLRAIYSDLSSILTSTDICTINLAFAVLIQRSSQREKGGPDSSSEFTREPKGLQ